MKNLVLLLIGGHVVRIRLREDDLPESDATAMAAREWLAALPATRVCPDLDEIVFAYVEDLTFPELTPGGGLSHNDFQRITVEPGGGCGYAG